MRVYERSALMLLNKAIYDTVPLAKIQRVVSQFSVSGGLYVEIQGDVVLDEELIQKLTDRMREMAEADLPVQKTSLPVEDAIARFRKVKMEEKVKLFRYRRSSWVNLYVIDGFIDYHYGYMVPSTGYLKVFALEKYHDGLVLRMPDGKKIDQLADFIPREKLFEVMQGSTAWGETMARLSPRSAFMSELLPALGGPARTTSAPSRSIFPSRAVAMWRRSAADSASRRVARSSAKPGGSSSSEKSSECSTRAERSRAEE